MQLGTRKILDRSFSGLGLISIMLISAFLLVFLLPIALRGMKAFVFRGTVEYRRLVYEEFGRGDMEKIEAEIKQTAAAREPVYRSLKEYEEQFLPEIAEIIEIIKSWQEPGGKRAARRISRGLGKVAETEHPYEKLKELETLYFKILNYRIEGLPRIKEVPSRIKDIQKQLGELDEIKDGIKNLFGPFPGDKKPVMKRSQYGQTRWDRALVKLDEILYEETWDYDSPGESGVLVRKARKEIFKGSALEEMFVYLEEDAEKTLNPRWTFYWRFLTDTSLDSHIFGGIWPEVLGTIYLSLGAMLFAIPMGVIAAIYLCEYAKPGKIVSFIRTCVSTLAGVPSIVFGLFGLAFFLNTIQVSDSKSILAGALTLSLLVLPTIIRASEEAILAVPQTYKEAALALGAGKWYTIMTVILPAALPGILTGIIISIGRAAGETAPIIFTAAVSVGKPVNIIGTLTQPTPALPWNIYNICTEHEAADEIRHVQYGMVLTLIAIVLLLNLTAIIMRAKISKKLKT